MAQEEYQIIDGPSKMDLMLGLFDNSNKHPRTVEFTIAPVIVNVLPDVLGEKEQVSVFVDSVQAEDGSGESWNICGRCADKRGKVKIYFSTQRRAGHLEFK